MNKSLVIVGAAVLAAAVTALAPAAEAGFRGGKGFRMGGGGGHRLHAFNHRHRHHHVRRRHIIVTPVITETVKRAPLVQEKIVVVKHADGMGRVYDLASRVWHDGQNHCWSGKFPWTFKNGSWFYGSFRWFQDGGTWRTNAPEAPFAVDCQTVPAFAARSSPTFSQSNGQKEIGGYSDQGEAVEPRVAPAPTAPPAKTAEKNEPAPLGNASKAGECKKYFPNVGEMLPVPCND